MDSIWFRCRQMGARCGVDVEVLLADENRTAAFWRFFKGHTSGVPGQKDSWRGPRQSTSILNSDGDRVGLRLAPTGRPPHPGCA